MSQAEESSSHSTWNIVRSVVCVILSLSFIIGTPGNCIVIWTVCTKMKQVSPSVLLILNLAIADVLVLITLPIWIYSFADSWVFGVIFCKILVFLIYCSMYASIFLITALSLERLMAVFYPFAIQRYGTKNISLIMFLIWFLSVAFGISVVPFQETEKMNGRLQCTCRNYSSNRQKVSYLLLETLAGFVIPFLIICTCYICVARRISRMTYQSKQRSERLIASVVVAFLLCWFPHHLFNILDIISIQIELSNEDMSLALDEVVGRGVYISGALVFISSCINPLLYAFAARRFQNHLRFAKISKLFEQMNHAVTEEDKRKSLVVAKQEDTLVSTENPNMEHRL